MALEKDIEIPMNGVTVKYHRIDSFNVSKDEVNMTVVSYLNEARRQMEKDDPKQVIDKYFFIAPIDFKKENIGKEGLNMSEAYDLLKTNEYFIGAKDA